MMEEVTLTDFIEGLGLPKELDETSACWGTSLMGSSKTCTPDFVSGKAHFKNKWCAHCRQNFISVPIDRIHTVGPSLPGEATNSLRFGFWKQGVGGELRRLVNHTATCTGPQLVIYRESPSHPQPADAPPLPPEWVSNGYIKLVVSKGTLVPAVAVRFVASNAGTPPAGSSAMTSSGNSTQKRDRAHECGAACYWGGHGAAAYPTAANLQMAPAKRLSSEGGAVGPGVGSGVGPYPSHPFTDAGNTSLLSSSLCSTSLRGTDEPSDASANGGAGSESPSDDGNSFNLCVSFPPLCGAFPRPLPPPRQASRGGGPRGLRLPIRGRRCRRHARGPSSSPRRPSQ